MPHVDVDGLSMYYEQHGDGPPLVLILGLSLDVSEVGPIVDGLAETYRVLVFDNRGAGRSDQPPGPYDIEGMARDTRGLMDRLGISSARVVGISMGAKIALALALAHPERVEDLVLVSGRCRASHHLRLSWPMRLARLVAWTPLFRPRYPQARAAYEAQRRASASYDCCDRLSTITAPVLVLHGERDRSAPVAEARSMAAGFPNARLRTFPGGHLFFLFGARAACVDAITSW